MPQARRLEKFGELLWCELRKSLRVAAAVQVLQRAVFVQAERGGGVVVRGGLAWKGFNGLAFVLGGFRNVDAAIGKRGCPDFVAADEGVFAEFGEDGVQMAIG